MKNKTYIQKISLIVFVLLNMIFMVKPVTAQWNFGGLININNSTVSVDPNPDSEDYSGRFGFGIGAVLDRPLTELLGLHAEPMYLQKGTKIDDDGNEISLTISYLELPVMVRYNFASSGSAMPYAMAGTY